MPVDTDLYDVIVVGSGPGGATAAYFLGEAGLRVLVLEKETLPRYKTCGGGLSSAVLDLFPFSFEPVIQSKVKEIRYALGNQLVNIPISGRSVRMVMRHDFDTFILSHARARVCQGTPILKVVEEVDWVRVITKDGQVFQARYLIGADGANSIVAHSLGMRREKILAGAIEVEATVPEETMQQWKDTVLFLYGEIKLGYVWIFPKANHLSIGIFGVHPKPGQLQAVLKRAMSQYGISLEGMKQHGHPIPIYTRREQIATSRVFLVGDAAGLADPFTGEGIRFAIKSGKMAVETILSGQSSFEYSRRVQKEIGRQHRLAAALSLLFSTFPRTCFALGVRNPFATQAFVDLFLEHIGYELLILRLFGTLPLFLGTELAAVIVGWLKGAEGKSKLRTTIYQGLWDQAQEL